MVEQTGEDRAIGVGEGGFANLALQDKELVPQRQDLDFLIAVAHRQETQERQGVGRGEVGQAHQHDRSSCRRRPGQVKTFGPGAGADGDRRSRP
ncbi:hypothetical protein [Wenjunlia tyrosinilytica]|uniref:hypothetical protein n=1 Tax=Wenjunlia tyrosinilytica TaxID=1544741 RepID=UPI001E3CDB26|nr:hypothetical protein [Wenjunlia tyrosinilytica]